MCLVFAFVNTLYFLGILLFSSTLPLIYWYVFIAVEYIVIVVEYIVIAVEYIVINVEYILIAVEYIVIAIVVEYIVIAVEYIAIVVEYIVIAVEYIVIDVEFKVTAGKFIDIVLRYNFLQNLSNMIMTTLLCYDLIEAYNLLGSPSLFYI